MKPHVDNVSAHVNNSFVVHGCSLIIFQTLVSLGVSIELSAPQLGIRSCVCVRVCWAGGTGERLHVQSNRAENHGDGGVTCSIMY